MRPIGNFSDVARASFFKRTGGFLAGSIQSKQGRIELLYRYKQPKTSRITRKAKSEAKSFSPLCGLQVDFRPVRGQRIGTDL